MVNLLIHQDYADHTRKAEIRYFQNGTIFWNPGDAFASSADLLEPGEKEVRNPRIVTAFRRIGFSENAGWGLRDVFRNWQQLGHVPPQIKNETGRKTFELTLRKEELLSEAQLLFQASLGVHLTDEQARVFAVVCREKEVSLSKIKAITGFADPEARGLADNLVTKVLLEPVEASQSFALAHHLQERFGPGSEEKQEKGTDQVGVPVAKLVSEPMVGLPPTLARLLPLCEVPRSLVELMEAINFSNRTHFRQKHLKVLLEKGLIQMTTPGKPRAKNQKYVAIPAGLRLITHLQVPKPTKEEPST